MNFQVLNQKLVFDYKNPWKILAFAEPDPPKGGEGEAGKSEKEKMRIIVDNVRTIIQRQNEYIYIPDLSPQGQI